VLDGDNIRTGLNSNLGFSDEDRTENIRRIAEVSKLFVDTGIITVNSFITPKKEHRNQARSIVGESDFFEIYIKCSFDACEQRDVKGLYAKAKSGKISNFTGRDSEFETPDHADLVIDTDKLSEQESLDLLYDFVLPEIRLEDVAGR
jgi:adenylylsulfate kinase